jgi:hypothetical protein
MALERGFQHWALSAHEWGGVSTQADACGGGSGESGAQATAGAKGETAAA